ncbi:MAG: carbohydrate ABC transporter permease [Clostridia bacterium]|nr:carbohydrate ABC transporter permease [Clostridia bacterium]
MTGENKFFKYLKIGIGFFVALLFLMPIFILVMDSFKNQKGILTDVLGWPNPFIFDNYPKAIEKMNFFNSLWNSVWITVVSTGLIVLFASMAAWVLVRYKTKMSKFMFILFSVALLIPFQCVMLPLMSVMGSREVMSFTLGEYTISLNGLNILNPGGLVFAYIGFGSSMAIMLYHGFIKSVPEELEEAAMIDGCSMFKTFWKIVFPLLSPITTTVAILQIMWIWNDYLLPSLVLKNQSWYTLPLQTSKFFSTFTSSWDVATAALILTMLPVIIFYIVAQKKIIKGVVDGAIK